MAAAIQLISTESLPHSMSRSSVVVATARVHKIFAGFISAAVVAVVTFAGSHGHAKWSSDPAVNNAICTAPNDQVHQHLARDAEGNTYISWSDKRDGFYQIYARKISRDGVNLWPTNGVLLGIGGNVQDFSRVIPDGQGGAIICWQDQRSDTGDIYAQRVNSGGSIEWGAAGLSVCTNLNGQLSPQIISAADGGAVITWQDQRAGTASPDIYVQKVSLSGQLMWTNEVAVSVAAGSQETPQIVSDGGSGFYIAWLDKQAGPKCYLHVQLFDIDGTPQWPENKSVASVSAVKAGLACAQDGMGGLIATWEDGTLTDGDIKAQRLGPTGEPDWDPNGIHVTRQSLKQTIPQVINDGNGGAFVVFEHPGGSAQGDIYIQRITSQGNVADNGQLVHENSSADQGEPELCADGVGGAFVTWEHKGSAAYGIYAQRYDGNRSQLWQAKQKVSDTTSEQQTPVIIADGDGGAIVSWIDLRGGSATRFDIYASRLAPDGTLSPPPSQAGPPAAPTNLTITDADLSLDLAWTDNATDETGYKVKRSVNGGTEEVIADLAAGSTSYSDSAINNCSVYSYSIVAYNTSGESAPVTGSHDNTAAPTIVLSGSNPVTFRYGSTFYDTGASATDGCGNIIHLTVTGLDAVDTNTIGSYTITYTATDTSGKTATATRTVNVVKANQAIAFRLPSERTYGDGPVTVHPTSNSGLPVDLAVSGPAILNGSTLTITGAGTVTVTATQPGNTNYNPAPTVERTLVVNKGRANISVIGYIGTYDGKAHTARGTALGIGAAPEDLGHLLNITGSFTEIPGGTATWTFAGNENYNAASGSVSINIRPPGPVLPMPAARP